MRLCFLIIGLILLLVGSAQAEILEDSLSSKNLQKLTNSYLQQNHVREHISAVTLTEDSGKALITVQSGYTEFLGKEPVAVNNLYQIGSITKSFISAVILQLEATPQLHFSIEDKLSSYLPQYPQWGNITIKQLLNMTSGIPDYLNDDHYLQDLAKNPNKFWLAQEQVAYVATKPLLFTPGEKWNYSNTNYILAGMVINKLTGHTVAEEINNRFLAFNNTSHLSLTHTFYPSQQKLTSMALIHGYHFGGTIGKYIPLTADITDFNLSYAGAAGAMLSNSADITRWIRALFTVDQVLPKKQLTELLTLVSMTTGQPLKVPNAADPNGFGLGVGMSYAGSNFPGLMINYEGMTLGYRAQYLYIPVKNIIITATVNSSVDSDNDYLIDLLGEAYNKSI